ncbi:MAG: hypothetical protein NZ581_08450, partial [Candidatus Caldarchaeum sp.]|nr:hypothetical protein [Candidatus Caldarchaeum sp.]MDW8436203.1 hypothetical protein [Candidatus Caldarchaeum sp.]
MSQTRKTTIAAVIFLVIGLAGGLLLGQVVSPSRTIITTATETRISTVSVTSLQTVVQTVTTTSVLTQVRELQKPEVEYAKLFDIDRGGDYTLLRDAVNRTILLVPREKPVPTIKADLVIRTPVERAVLMSSTHV